MVVYKQFIFKLLLIIFTVSLCLAIFEFSFRLIGYVKGVDYRKYLAEISNPNRHPAGLFTSEPTLLTVLTPNADVLAITSDYSVRYKINSKGLRYQETGYQKPQNTFRILAFGDSFTFGEGVSIGERFTDILETKLSNSQVINFGVPAFSAHQALAFYSLEGQKYQADWVVLFVNYTDLKRTALSLTSNQPFNPNQTQLPTFAPQTDTLILNKDQLKSRSSTNWFYQHSYALSYGKYLFTLLDLNQELKSKASNFWQQVETSEAAPLNDQGLLYVNNQVKFITTSFNNLAHKNGSQFLIVNIDTPGELDYMKAVDDFISKLDLSANLEEYSKTHTLTFKYDRHYSPQTHAYIGNLLANYFSKLSH